MDTCILSTLRHVLLSLTRPLDSSQLVRSNKDLDDVKCQVYHKSIAWIMSSGNQIIVDLKNDSARLLLYKLPDIYGWRTLMDTILHMDTWTQVIY